MASGAAPALTLFFGAWYYSRRSYQRLPAMRITSKGQVTIPQEIREKLGLLPNTEVEFVVDGRSVRIIKARTRRGRGRGESVVQRLRGRATVAMTTDEILALTRKGA